MKKVQVLMSTYNGEKYVEEQIKSILCQKNVEVSILVRDDGSKDNTTTILDTYKNEGKLDWYKGDNVKSARSFMELVKKASQYDYYAFSDQDDFWEEDKLISAIDALERNESENGKLYISALNVVDENLNYKFKTKLPSIINLKNEMIKNYATGCTMVFDENLRKLICSEKYEYIAMHDSYVYRIALLNKAFIYNDNESHIKYRQHGSNVLGMTNNFFKVWKTRWKHFIHSDCIASNTAKDLLKNKTNIDKNDYEYLNMLATYKKDFKNKIKLLHTKIFSNEEKMTNLLFKIKLIFNRI